MGLRDEAEQKDYARGDCAVDYPIRISGNEAKMPAMRPWAVLVCAALGACAPVSNMPSPTVDRDRDIITIDDGGKPVQLTVDRDPSRHKVPAALTRSWNSLASVYEALGIPIEYADGRTNKVGNTRFITSRTLARQPMSRFLRCGVGMVGPLADTHRIQMSIWTQLQPIGADSTAVFTQIEAKGSPVDGTSGTVICVTTGMLEWAIVSLLKQRVTPPTE